MKWISLRRSKGALSTLFAANGDVYLHFVASTLIKCQFHSHLSSIKGNATTTNFSTVHTLRYEGKGRKHAITNFPPEKAPRKWPQNRQLNLVFVGFPKENLSTSMRQQTNSGKA